MAEFSAHTEAARLGVSIMTVRDAMTPHLNASPATPAAAAATTNVKLFPFGAK